MVCNNLFFVSQLASNASHNISNNFYKPLSLLPIFIEPVQILYASIIAFMMLIILVLRRINKGIINALLEQYGKEKAFLPRPPMYNLAISCLLLYLLVELIMPNSPVLGWLAFAIACALLNLFDDFIDVPMRVLLCNALRYLLAVIVLMAGCFLALGWDYLHDNVLGLHDLRHIVTTGVIGLGYMVIMAIMAIRHTGRALGSRRYLDITVVSILVAIFANIATVVYPLQARHLYLSALLLLAMSCGLYLWRFGRYLLLESVSVK